MSAHIKHAVSYWGDAWARVRSNTTRQTAGCEESWITEGAHCYWDNLPKLVQTLREKNGEEIKEHVVLEAWAVMMLRAFCWWRCHWVDQGWVGDVEKRVDPRYAGSEVKVIVL